MYDFFIWVACAGGTEGVFISSMEQHSFQTTLDVTDR
jgi:hypothetical protein